MNKKYGILNHVYDGLGIILGFEIMILGIIIAISLAVDLRFLFVLILNVMIIVISIISRIELNKLMVKK